MKDFEMNYPQQQKQRKHSLFPKLSQNLRHAKQVPPQVMPGWGLGPDSDDSHDRHAEGDAKKPDRRLQQGVGDVVLVVVHVPLGPKDAHSCKEKEAAADGIDDSDGDQNSLGLARVASVPQVGSDPDADAHGGCERVKGDHGELLPEAELGVQNDLADGKALEELVEGDCDDERIQLFLVCNPRSKPMRTEWMRMEPSTRTAFLCFAAIPLSILGSWGARTEGSWMERYDSVWTLAGLVKEDPISICFWAAGSLASSSSPASRERASKRWWKNSKIAMMNMPTMAKTMGHCS